MLVISHMPKDGCSTRMTPSRISHAFIIKSLFILFLLLIGMSNVSAGELKQEITVVDVPVLSKRVTDISKVLTKAENQRLTRQLKKLQSERKVQMAVLIIPTTGSDTVEAFSSHVFDKWKLGNKEHNDGILFLIASDDHKMRIAIGSGLERQLTDGKIAGILRKDVKPAFKENAYFEGISNAIDSVDILLNKPGQAETQQEVANIAKAFEENGISDKISDESLAVPFGFCVLSLLLLPWTVFRKGHWFKRFLKCALTTVAVTYVLSLVGIFPPIPLEFYLLIFLLPVILIFLVIFSVFSMLKSLFSSLFGGLFGGSGSDRTKSDNDDDSFFGGGGSSTGGGASGDW
ncbi:TPM domain-containing protein [Xenorhabdus anantnagensis]|uniref:TPM domain-containing protein n=1 Tax=Xenorhabdus anantnagensis TaxID=3025875 RepID=A0ABT5LRM6_9GAMM|nr:TPM domain-containing protein [Xenorhabdus anantnagensis]MDC9596879.1 TPM domain-containing protein [Xenorhabdus anantnagensis]